MELTVKLWLPATPHPVPTYQVDNGQLLTLQRPLVNRTPITLIVLANGPSRPFPKKPRKARSRQAGRGW